MATILPRCGHNRLVLLQRWPGPSILRLNSHISPSLLVRCDSSTAPRWILPSATRNFASKKGPKPPVKPATKQPHRTHPPPKSKSTTPLPYRTARASDDVPQFPIPSGNLYAQMLATKSSPTVLYRDRPSNIRPFAAAAVGGVLGAIALVNIHHEFFFPNPGIWWLVPWMSLTYNLVILGAGVFIATRKMRPISSITALNAHPGLKLIIKGSEGPKVPLLNFRLWTAPEIECSVQEVMLKKDILHHQLPISPRARAEMTKTHWERPSQMGMRDQLIFPIRNFFRAIVNLFKDNILMEGTLGLFVKGEKRRNRWDLDVRRAWMLENGKALESLLLRSAHDKLETLKFLHERRR